MTLLESALRLMTALAVLIWLPGWLAGRHPLRTAPILHAVLFGTGIYLAVLVAVATLEPRTHLAAPLVVTGILAAVAMLAWRRLRRPGSAHEAHPLALPWPLAVIVTIAVAGATVLRYFHNYHFDDFQHLVYLTEIDRQGVLFPRSLMLHVEWGSLPDRPLIVSRYPFWAAHIAVLSHLTGVPLGDAYYLLGLATVGFLLALITAMLRHVLASTAAAAAGLAALLAGGHLLTADEILNFGGYPFQTGKLFVIVAAIACVAYWRAPVRLYAACVGIALFAAPLMHTNNILGTAVVGGGATLAAAVIRTRVLPLGVAAAMGALLVTTLAAVLSGGFVRFTRPADELNHSSATLPARTLATLPDNVAAERTVHQARAHTGGPTPVARFEGHLIVQDDGWYYAIPDGVLAAAGGAERASAAFRARSREEVEGAIARALAEARSIDEQAVGAPGNVRGRLALFVRRALPLELLPVFAVLAVQWRVRPARARRLTAAILALCLAIIGSKSAVALVRQIASATFKPGYLVMRSSLVAARGLVDERADILMDPITHVYGHAAGWSVTKPPAFGLEDQFMRLLVFHPGVRGEALRYLLTLDRSRLLVINEAVLGPAAAAKFLDLPDVAVMGQTGPTLPRADELKAKVEAAVERTYALGYAGARRDPGISVGMVWSILFRRPLYVLSASADRIPPPDPQSFAALAAEGAQADDRTAGITVRPHLNSMLLHAELPEGCFAQAALTLEGTASFSAPVLVHLLPAGRAPVHWTTATHVTAGTVTTARIGFLSPVCGPGAVTFFLHGGHLYDLRFRVHGVDWTHPMRLNGP